MIRLLSGGKPDLELTIQKGTLEDRKKLLSLKNEAMLGDGVDLIYLYSLVDEVINYPSQDGSIIYIGEAGRERKTGTRFSQHISTEENIGGDTGTNFTISKYYWLGKKLKLEIYILDSQRNKIARKSIESQLFQLHLRRFGALPIGQGASGDNYKVTLINSLKASNTLASIIKT
ncbi:hypothetical protein [Enterovibrio norvegicus]|uniref:hypothetical protein n=1 Tax=Enterovibrio norvegicus TaxID=188144 RepID=UPI00352D3B12